MTGPLGRPLAAALIAAAAVPLSAMAQDAAPAQAAATQTAPTQAKPAPVVHAPPPPVVVQIPQDTGVSAPTSRRGGIGDPDSATPVNPEAAAQAAADEARRRSASARPAPRSARNSAPVVRATLRAPVAPAAATSTPAPAATPASAPVATSSPAATPSPATVASDADTGNDTDTVATADNASTTTSTGRMAWWPWALGALAVLALAAALLFRRWREDDGEPAHVEPTYVDPVNAEPVAADHAVPMAERSPVIDPAPVAQAAAAVSALPLVDGDQPATAAPDDVTVAEPDADDVAALTAATPAGDRPWLKFALRPVRAGVGDEDALVEVELTVGNAGAMTAEDVRIATYLLEHGGGEAIATLLANPPATDSAPATIAGGEGTRVDAILSLPRATRSDGFSPVVVADARYRWAGGEGRTSAAFRIGVALDDGGMAPLLADGMGPREDVTAGLVGTPTRD